MGDRPVLRPALRASTGRRRTSVAPLMLFLFATASLGGGAALLVVDCLSGASHVLRGAAGLLFILCGLVQIVFARRAWRMREQVWRFSFYHGRFIVCALSIGLAMCYLAALFTGPRPGVEIFFLALVTAWITGIVWPPLAAPCRLARLRSRFAQGIPRTLGFCFGGILLAGLVAEIAIRSVDFVSGNRWKAAYTARQIKLLPGERWGNRSANSLGYLDKEFVTERTAGCFRIAVLGDEVSLDAAADADFAHRLQREIPGVEILNFALPSAGPREYAATCRDDVFRFQPHLVICCLSVGDDITHQVPVPGWFDWSGLRTYQIARRFLSADAPPRVLPSPLIDASPDQLAHLRSTAARLLVCRAPIDAGMQRRWNEGLGHLENLVSDCRQRELPVALVVVPGEFQLDRLLATVASRRGGFSPEELDLDLPQRRLAVFAEERGVPMLDLLPHLKASGEPAFERNTHRLSDRGSLLVTSAVRHWLLKSYGQQIAEVTPERTIVAVAPGGTIPR